MFFLIFSGTNTPRTVEISEHQEPRSDNTESSFSICLAVFRLYQQLVNPVDNIRLKRGVNGLADPSSREPWKLTVLVKKSVFLLAEKELRPKVLPFEEVMLSMCHDC